MGVTWNNQPSSGGLIKNYGAVASATMLEIDVTDAVAAEYAGDGIWSIALKGAEAGSSLWGASLRSKEAAGLKPYLEINPPPYPVKIAPSADAWVVTATDGTGPEQDNNYGSNRELRIGDSDHPRHNRSFMKFDLSGIAGGTTITNAKLHVYCATGGTGLDLGLYEVADDTWTEMGVTWNNQPSYGGLIVDYGAVASATMLEIDVTDAVAAEYAGDGIWSIALKGVEAGGNVGASLRSKEATVGLRPYLEVTTIPGSGATVVGWSVTNDMMRLVIAAPGSASIYYPKTTTDLVLVPWGSVAHSDDGVNPSHVTNLNYSTADGANKVIYVQANGAEGFFGIGGEE